MPSEESHENTPEEQTTSTLEEQLAVAKMRLSVLQLQLAMEQDRHLDLAERMQRSLRLLSVPTTPETHAEFAQVVIALMNLAALHVQQIKQAQAAQAPVTCADPYDLRALKVDLQDGE